MSIFLRKYATATTVYFPLIGAGTVNFTSTASLTTADLKLSIDGAAFGTVGTAVTNVGSFGYSYTCTTADLTGKRVMFIIHHTAGSQLFEDTALLVETYGNTAAAHTFDFSIANQTVIASAGTVTLTGGQLVTVGTISAAAVGAGLLSAGAFAAGFLSSGGVAAGALTSGAFAAGFLSAGGIAANAISAGGIATAAITSAKIATGGFDPTNFAAGFLSAGGIAANAISAGGIATDAIDADALAADAVSEIWGLAAVPPTAVPANTASMLSTVSWLFALSKFTITQTSVLQVVKQSDGSTTLAQSTCSDDSTTFQRGSFN